MRQSEAKKLAGDRSTHRARQNETNGKDSKQMDETAKRRERARELRAKNRGRRLKKYA